MDTSDNSVASGMLLGAVAGAVGVWAMDRVDWFNYRRVDAEARRRTQGVRPGGEDTAHVMARTAERAAGAGLPPPQHHAAGTAIHYAIGIGPGALYGALRDRLPQVVTARGALYGLGLFLLQDELGNAALGTGAYPRAYPWQAHARGLVAHLVYGVVTDAVLGALRRAVRPASRA